MTSSGGRSAGAAPLALRFFFWAFFLYLFGAGSLFGRGVYCLGVGSLGIGPAPFILGTGPALGTAPAVLAPAVLGIGPLPPALADALGVGPAFSALLVDGIGGLTY